MNSKQRHRSWFITVNNPELELKEIELQAVLLFEEGSIKYFGGQFERGVATGTLHLQAAIQFKSAKTLTAVKDIPFLERSSLQPVKSWKKTLKYITKKETRVDGPVEVGVPPNQGSREDLHDLTGDLLRGTSLEDVADETPWMLDKAPRLIKFTRARFFTNQAYERYDKFTQTDAKKIVRYLYGPPRSGKTRFVYEKVDRDDLYVLEFNKGSQMWFDGYAGQRCLLIDDYLGQMSADEFLHLTDIYPTRVPVKGDFVNVNFEEVYITSNLGPMSCHEKAKPMVYEAVQTRLNHQSDVLDARSVPFLKPMDQRRNPTRVLMRTDTQERPISEEPSSSP